MKALRTAFGEFVGLFIDDGSQALFTVVLIAIVVIVVKLFGMPAFWGALLLVAGCFTILGESVFRAARGR
jgi:hypothetical protein